MTLQQVMIVVAIMKVSYATLSPWDFNLKVGDTHYPQNVITMP